MKMEVQIGQRIVGSILNIIVSISFIGLIVNLFLLWFYGSTIGGYLLGYKYNKKGWDCLSKVLLGVFIYYFLGIITFTLFFWWDGIIAVDKNNCTLWEKWFNIRKFKLKSILA